MVSAVKSCEILPTRNRYTFIRFLLHEQIKNCCFYCNAGLDKIISCFSEIDRILSISSNQSVGSSPRIKISFFLLSACPQELLLLLLIANITFLSNPPPPDNEKDERASNPTRYPEFVLCTYQDHDFLAA